MFKLYRFQQHIFNDKLSFGCRFSHLRWTWTRFFFNKMENDILRDHISRPHETIRQTGCMSCGLSHRRANITHVRTTCFGLSRIWLHFSRIWNDCLRNTPSAVASCMSERCSWMFRMLHADDVYEGASTASESVSPTEKKTKVKVLCKQMCAHTQLCLVQVWWSKSILSALLAN